MMRRTVAARLAALYATMLGITVIVVILASSAALVVELGNFTGDIAVAKHEEARALADLAHDRGQSLASIGPQIVSRLSDSGLRVAVYDEHGTFLAGDSGVHPPLLDQVLKGDVKLINDGSGRLSVTAPPSPASPDQTPGSARVVYERIGSGDNQLRPIPFSLTRVAGGYVAFAPSITGFLASMLPYWRVVVTIAIVAILLSWLVGALVARQALAPINEIVVALRALADGDFAKRTFAFGGRDEIGVLTSAYNAAATGVAAAMEERRSTEERMRRFVADAGHELRTPLTVIGGYIDVLRRGAVDEPKIARQILGTMGLEKEHMRGLIDRLVRLARMDTDEPPTIEAIDVPDLLRRQCEAARRVDDDVAIDFSADGATTVRADRSELSEALWNVIENSLKYAPQAPIHLRAAQCGGRTVISIHDEGPGMTEVERLHAFERFYRGDRRGEIAGSGLGLAIAKRAVERAGGTIELESAPGHGTTVTIAI